jgi:hypothetical protein
MSALGGNRTLTSPPIDDAINGLGLVRSISMRKGSVWLRAPVGLAFTIVGIDAHAWQFVPPAGYSGHATLPGVASPAEAGAPPLTRISDAKLSDRFRVNSTYRRPGHVKIVGAFEIGVPKRERLVAAWATGFLPVTLSFSDGRCFSLTADYVGGTLSKGRLNRVSCERRPSTETPAPPQPSDSSLQLVGTAWGYDAWAHPGSGTTIVTAPYAKAFEPLFTARMATSAIMAMNGPDWPGGNVTLVGKIDGRLTVVTLEVGY